MSIFLFLIVSSASLYDRGFVMPNAQPTNSADLLEGIVDEDVSLGHVVPKAPGTSPSKADTKTKYAGLLKEDLRGKWVRKEPKKLPVSKLTFDDSLHNGDLKTRDSKVGVLHRGKQETNPPYPPAIVWCWLHGGVYYVSCAVELMRQTSFVLFPRCGTLLVSCYHQTHCFL